jgi:hypothetical protein
MDPFPPDEQIDDDLSLVAFFEELEDEERSEMVQWFGEPEEPEWSEDELWALMLSMDDELGGAQYVIYGEVLMSGVGGELGYCVECEDWLWSFDRPQKYSRLCWRCNSESAKKWCSENPERHKANKDRWIEENKEKWQAVVRRNGHKRRARLADIPGDGFSAEQEAAELRRLDNKCALCEIEMVHYSTHKEMLDSWSETQGKGYQFHPQYRTLEHKKPVASGDGSNRPEDLTFTCRFCNKGVGSWEYRVERAKARKEGK